MMRSIKLVPVILWISILMLAACSSPEESGSNKASQKDSANLEISNKTKVNATNATSATKNGMSTKEKVKAMPGSIPEPRLIKVPEKITDVKENVITLVVPQKEKFKKGIFWKIERPGYKPSYLLGTMHSPHPDVIALREVIKKQFKQTSVLCTEINMGLTMMTEMAKLKHLMTFPEGESLSKTIGPEMFADVAKKIKSLGIGVSTLDRMRPWVVNVRLSMPKSSGAIALDMKLALDASSQRKKLCGLEKVKEQLNALAGAPKEYHIRALRLTLKYFDKVQSMAIKLRKLYLSRDLVAMSDTIENSPIPVLKEDMQNMIFRLVIRRNIIMANRMQPYLKTGNVFFAVGALHLPGKGGLLRLLESQGFRLTRLY